MATMSTKLLFTQEIFFTQRSRRAHSRRTRRAWRLRRPRLSLRQERLRQVSPPLLVCGWVGDGGGGGVCVCGCGCGGVGVAGGVGGGKVCESSEYWAVFNKFPMYRLI